jgi:hypothetical protein
MNGVVKNRGEKSDTMGSYDQQLFRISKLLSVCVYVLPGPVKRLHIHRLKKNRLKMCIHIIYNCRWRGDDDDGLHRPGCVALLLLLNPKKMPQFHEPVARSHQSQRIKDMCV